MSMSHPEHEDPAMTGHDDEAAERAEAERAAKVLFESALNAMLDASDNAKAAAADLLEADPGFELATEMRDAIRHLDLVKSRVAERLGYLESFAGEPEASSEPATPPAGSADGDRRLAGHPSEREALRGFTRSTLASRPMDLVEMHRLWAEGVSDLAEMHRLWAEGVSDE